MQGNDLFKGAYWMWPGVGAFYYEFHNAYAQFRRDFRLPRVPRTAPFYVTADQQYMLYVNGRYVGRGPARAQQELWSYDEYDLAPYLARGGNWISVQAYNAGVGNYQYVHRGVGGFLCAGRWGKVDLASGTAWLVRMSPAHKACTERLSKQLNFQEHVDARLDDQSWIRSPRPPTGWPPRAEQPTFAVWRVPGAMPWHGLEPRNIPNLGNNLVVYRNTCRTAAGRCAPLWQDSPNVSDLLFEEMKRLTWRAAPPGRATRDGLVVTLPAAGPDRMAAVSMKLAESSVGTLVVDAAGARGGEVVDFFFCEALTLAGAPVLEPKHNACGASFAVRLVLKPGRTRYEFFQMIGHSYLTAIARGTKRPITLKLALRETIYPLAVKGRFACSDDVLSGIHRISARTQRVCMLDAYVDTPWREQAQWWGDARVQVWNTFHLSGDTRLMVRGIRCHARQTAPNGLTYGHVPTIAHHCILPDFSLIWILTLWDYYWQTGDLSLFREQWPQVQRILGYFTGEGRGSNGLLRFDPRYWLFLDWSDIYKEGTPALLNLWYLNMLQHLATLTGLAGMKDEQRRIRALCAEQKRLVLARFWDARAGLFRDGLTAGGRPVNVHSIHTQTLAIMCGLKPQSRDALVSRRLLPYVRGRKVPGAQPSCYWITYVYGVLRDLGYGADVVRHIRRIWGPMVPFGGTFEDGKTPIGKASATHAWSAHPVYHLAGSVGGIVQRDVAWRRIAFAPLVDLAEVSDARCVVPTPHGLVRARWQRDGRTVDVSLALPRGVAADVKLPGLKRAAVTGANRWRVEL